ncbi:MAG: NADH-quinone oxidoreductase subunit K [Candidatus Omnitrophota bacterium]|jgi:NADH:ubiquinone oxidoreductase subunit K
MTQSAWQLFSIFGFFTVMLFIAGAYCILATRGLIRTIIGIELLIKAATLLVMAAGYASGRIALAQSIVITIIVIEVVFVVIAGGISLSIFRHNNDLDVRRLQKLKG